jgi:FMN hydrolase / 5-amino-6-(5-phospho-D-ribitylamino)uracil phosphatase
MQQIRAISLDLDDTLWAIAPVIERAERSVWEWLNSEYPRIGEHWDRGRVASLREEVMTEHAAQIHDLRFLRRTVLARMAKTAGYGSELVDEAFAIFDEQRNMVELFPDVVPGLQRLAKDFRLLALTNGNASLETIGIRHLFADVIAAADVGAAKPDARIFAAACDLTGLRADQILHVGDHPELDVDGARAAGMRTAWVNRIGAEWPATLQQPDATVQSMEELADWLHPVVAARGS